jgi:hypothetical protein
MMTGVLLGSQYGIQGVAVGLGSALWVLTLPSIAYAIHGTPVTSGVLLRAAGRPIVSAGVAMGLTTAFRGLWAGPDGMLAGLLWSAIVYGVAYLATWLSLPGGRAAGAELIRAVRSIRAKEAAAA